MSRKIQEKSILSESSDEEVQDKREERRSPPAESTSRKQSSKKRKNIAPASCSKKTPARELFGTDSENEEESSYIQDGGRKNKTTTRAPSPSPGCSYATEPKPHKKSAPESRRREVIVTSEPDAKKRKTVTSSNKPSAKEVFGSDSDDEKIEDLSRPGKKHPALISYFTKRIASGLSRQSDAHKSGSHYVELKVYKCEEIQNVAPMNRWRHAIITIKNKTDDDSEAWSYLTQFIKATRQEFKDCRPEIISSYSTY